MIRLDTGDGTPLVAMQRYAPLSPLVTRLRLTWLPSTEETKHESTVSQDCYGCPWKNFRYLFVLQRYCIIISFTDSVLSALILHSALSGTKILRIKVLFDLVDTKVRTFWLCGFFRISARNQKNSKHRGDTDSFKLLLSHYSFYTVSVTFLVSIVYRIHILHTRIGRFLLNTFVRRRRNIC